MSEGPAGWGAPLYARVLELGGIGPGSSVLDLGCGTGEFARTAADRGAAVTGIDLDRSAIAAAERRVPEGRFLLGDAHDPPPGPFALVAAVQVLGHVADPVGVLRAAAGVAPVVVATGWGPAEDCDVRAFGEALAPWLPPWPAPPAGRADPLRALVAAAGLRLDALDEVECPFTYPDEDALLAPLFDSGIGRHAVNRGGPAAVREAVLARLADLRTAAGEYVLTNRFRVVLVHAG